MISVILSFLLLSITVSFIVVRACGKPILPHNMTIGKKGGPHSEKNAWRVRGPGFFSQKAEN